jgi:hypothetical protein
MSKWSERAAWLSAAAVFSLLGFLVFTRGADYTVIDSDWAMPFLIASAIAGVSVLLAVGCWVRAILVRESGSIWLASVSVALSVCLVLWMAGWILASITRFSPSFH